MARSVKLFSSDSASGLESDLTAFLATLPLANQTIHGLHFEVVDRQRYTGVEYTCMLVYDDTAGAAIANPFTAEVYSESTLSDLQDAIDAAVAAAPAELFVPVKVVRRSGPASLVGYQVWMLRNALLAADANVDFP
jgi:hypothetical protein